MKGPAAKMMAELGVPASAAAIARHYAGLADALVIDEADRGLEAEIRALGMEVLVAKTVMRTLADREALAAACLGLLARLAGER